MTQPEMPAGWPASLVWALPQQEADSAWMAQWAADLDWQAEWHALQAEAMGWQPLGSGVYVHSGAEPALQVCVVGVPDPALHGQCVVLLA